MILAMTGHRRDAFSLLIPMFIILVCGFGSCRNPGIERNKIVYINSYHRGFPPSDLITNAILDAFPADSFEVFSFFMDTKRNPSEAFIVERAEELLDSIHGIRPELLIVSDDNALKYLVVPNFQNDPLPIVFCGVNWTAQQYDIADCNITGVLEILPVADLLKTLEPYFPEMKKLLVLNENTTTSRKTVPLLDTLLGNMGLEVAQELVDDFDSWKSLFSSANEEYDIIYLQTRGAIKGWEHEEAIKHIEQHIKIPVVTCEEFMMPYAVFGLTQLSEEQGSLAAQKAKAILKGVTAKDIPLSKNKLSKIWINPGLADQIDFKADSVLLKVAHIIE